MQLHPKSTFWLIPMQHSSAPLLASDEAFQYYTLALIKTGRNSELEKAAELREKLLSSIPASSVSSGEGQSNTDPSSQVLQGSKSPLSEQLGASRSQKLAQSVLAAFQTKSLPPIQPPRDSQASIAGSPLAGAGGGSVNSPIYVTIAECECFANLNLSFLTSLQLVASSGRR